MTTPTDSELQDAYDSGFILGGALILLGVFVWKTW